LTHQFFIQNVGVLGDVKDKARVENQQTATLVLDLTKVVEFVEQARRALPLLPEAVKGQLDPVLIDLDKAARGNDHSKARSRMESARTIAEGAAGNLVAEGIVGMIAGLLG
jgi:hypothetical protein